MLKPIAVYYEHCDSDWSVPKSVIGNHILLIVTEGVMHYQINDTEYLIQKGEALYVPKGVIRSAKHLHGQKHEMYAAHFHCEGEGVPLPLFSSNISCKARITSESYFKHRFSLLTQQWLRKNTYYEVTCHCILLELLTLLNIEITHNEDPSVNNLVLQIKEYITNHYREKITLADLAAVVERTPNYISTAFHNATGQTISEYTKQIKLSAARDLLTKSTMSIGEISDYLGFCEQSYFNKVFKKATGVSPSAYIREKKLDPSIGAIELTPKDRSLK